MALIKASSALLYYTLRFSIAPVAVRSMTTVTRRASGSTAVAAEETYTCSDGVQLAVRHWTNGVVDGHAGMTPSSVRKVLCLHGWLDNAASFDRLAPLLLDPPSSTLPAEIVALDFPGHGLSAHKSVDGPPQLLAEYAYYVAELVEALGWGGGTDAAGSGAGRTVVGNIKSNTNASKVGGGDAATKGEMDNAQQSDRDKIILVGHSMGSGVAAVLCAAFPEWFSALILLEGGLVARDADDASKHVRAAVKRRLKSNRTLFPNAGNGFSDGGDSSTAPRAKVYASLDAAIEARLSTTRRMPGDQFLSYEAARDMVLRVTSPAVSSLEEGGGSNSEGGVVFRHDPRLQWPSLQYYTREQVEAFFRDVNASHIPVCFLWAADGWPVDAWAERMVREVLRPGRLTRLSGSHHFHADPDSVGTVANEILAFLEENNL